MPEVFGRFRQRRSLAIDHRLLFPFMAPANGLGRTQVENFLVRAS